MTLKISEAAGRRFLSKVSPPDGSGCHLWTGLPDSAGYGRFWLDRHNRAIPAHRVAWALATGEDPTGRVIMHACDTPLCVAPAHLSAGSHAENVADKVAKSRHAWPRLAGERNPRAKLTDAQVEEARALMAAGAQVKAVALRFGVHPNTMSAIKNGRRLESAATTERAMA